MGTTLQRQLKDTYIALRKNQTLTTANNSERLLMINVFENSDYYPVCECPAGTKWVISKEKWLDGTFDRANAMAIECNYCDRLTNDFGTCDDYKCKGFWG